MEKIHVTECMLTMWTCVCVVLFCMPFCQVMLAVDIFRADHLSLRPLEEWVAAERRRKVQEDREMAELEAEGKAQVARPRQRWCIGSGEWLLRSVRRRDARTS